MTITTTFKNIGFGDYADAEIKIVRQFTPSNDFEGCFVFVNGEIKSNDIAVKEAIEKALDERTAQFLLEHM